MTAPVPREHFLPANATPFETSLSEALARLDDIPVPIDTLWNWRDCPASHLPFLAWAVSVDFWNDGWDETRKRHVIRDAFNAHQLKGTLAGVKKYLSYADAVLKKAVLPPQEGFLAPRDEDAINRWREKLPQIHIRPVVTSDNEFTFYCDASFADEDFVGDNDIGLHIRREAYFVHGGEEMPLSWVDGAGPFTPDGVERLALPEIAPWGAFALDDDFMDHDAFIGDYEGDLAELISLERGGISHVLESGYRATAAEPDLVPIEYIADAAELYLGGFADDGHLGGYRLEPDFYEKFYLWQPSLQEPAPADPYIYLDHTRLGHDPYTAELTVKINDTTDDREFLFCDDDFVDQGFVEDPDFSDLWRTLEAINSAKSARDRVLVDTAYMHIVTFGDSVAFGDLILGDFIEG